MIKILICGDFAPNRRIANLIELGDYSFFDEVKPIAEHADYAILNLETPVVEDNSFASPIIKSGPIIKCSPNAMDAVVWAGFNCITLANNHCFDYGQKGIEYTLKHSERVGLEYVGAGRDINEAQSILIKEINNEKIAIINYCEHEFNIATETHGGGNPLNPVLNYYDIKRARKEADYVIVIIHGGTEDYQLPTPRMVDNYRFFIDCGADAVINGHQHCYGGYEIYKSKPIFYGLGNFCFDSFTPEYKKEWTEGYMVELSLVNKDLITFDTVPYVQCAVSPKVKIMKDNEYFYKHLNSLNEIIENPLMLEKEFCKMAKKENRFYYLSPYSNKYIGWLKTHKLLPRFIEKRLLTLRQIINIDGMLRCESHIDILRENIKSMY